jgi:hypothetical protein
MPAARGAEFESILAAVFRKAGWRVRRHPTAGDMRADFVFEAGDKKYVVDLKEASEGRHDRLLPLLSQTILQAMALARRFPEPVVPLAVVAAPRVPPSVAERLKQFAERYAPDVAVGVIDAEGFRSFAGPGLEGLDAKPPRSAERKAAFPERLPDLFSDLNQWMLKILLGRDLPDSLMRVPRGPIRNASQLAEAAEVSIMSASRFVNQLANQGFLDESAEHLKIVRIDDLLELWISANRNAAKEIPARWILKGGQHQLLAALRKYMFRAMHNQPRCCLGLFAAADALGFGFVHGVPPHIYLERLTLDSLDRLGLAVGHSNRPADVYIRIPVSREAIFRASVTREGIPTSDALQVWLDVSTNPARGREQAREIQRRVLKPLFGKER